MTKPQACHLDQDRGWCTVEHVRDCTDRSCAGCKPCDEDHCDLRGCPNHVNHTAGLWTCPRCIGKAKRILADIVDLYALADVDVELRHAELGQLLEQAAETGVESEAFNLIGPAAAPEQYSEKRARLRALYERRGWCDWPRHEGFHDDDPHHPYAVLARWDLAMRERYGPQSDLFVTVSSAADYLTGLLNRGFPHTREFEQFDQEIRTCHAHLEQVIRDDRAPEKGAPCPACAAARGKGAPRLQKRYAVHPGLPAGARCGAKDGSRGRVDPCPTCDGKLDTWHCPDAAEHWWSDEDYRLRVDGAYIEHATTLPALELADRLGISVRTVRRWAGRTLLDIVDGEPVYGDPKLKPCGRSKDGRKLYRVADAQALMHGPRHARPHLA